jgi:hypothetical protein
MVEQLQEYCSSRGLTIPLDRASAVIRGVKLLGLASKNGREYPPAVLERARALYEAAKVNVNHPKGHPSAPRDYQDRIGVIRAVEVRAGDGLFGDLHYNPKHVLAEQLAWDAEHAPENVGFSHNVKARTSRRGEAVIVEEILAVNSVDLVADPATTSGLFESRVGQSEAEPHQETQEVGGPASAAADLSHPTTDATLSHPTADVAGQIAQLREEVAALRTEITEQRRSSPTESPSPRARDQSLVELRSFESLEEFVRAIRH